MRETFYIKDGEGWRPPEVNETCCARPALADLLEAVAQAGPAALDQHAQVLTWDAPALHVQHGTPQGARVQANAMLGVCCLPPCVQIVHLMP